MKRSQAVVSVVAAVMVSALIGQATAQGDTTAEYELGLKYKNGWGVPQNDVQAFDLFQSAAQGGNIEAEDELA